MRQVDAYKLDESQRLAGVALTTQVAVQNHGALNIIALSLDKVFDAMRCGGKIYYINELGL